MSSFTLFEHAIGLETGQNAKVLQVRSLAGGCINKAYEIITDGGHFFLKTNQADEANMFKTESKGLELLASTHIISVPEVLGHGIYGQQSYLLLAYLEPGPPRYHYWEDFGQKLAALHAVTANQYGLGFDNYIGRLPQRNDQMTDWPAFFIQHRLQAQLTLAYDQSRVHRSLMLDFEKLFARLPEWLPNEPPALLHGDLWSGNVMIGQDGLVSVVDPAVYFGHREVELAFTRLFGGFEPEFYQAYGEAAHLLSDFEDRVDLYNLYPLLVHVNLFGGGYVNTVARILKRYV